ncbi:MAG: transaldolase family protein, partial [Actinomycetales bacterium]
MAIAGAERLAALDAAGVSIWLDDLDRQRISSGNLAELVSHWSVTGVTTNPSIFDQALSRNSVAYADDLRSCAERGMSIDDTITQLTTDDVRAACGVFHPLWERTDGAAGLVSIEVDPRLAHDTEGTIAAALDLWSIVNAPNVMI